MRPLAGSRCPLSLAHLCQDAARESVSISNLRQSHPEETGVPAVINPLASRWAGKLMESPAPPRAALPAASLCSQLHSGQSPRATPGKSPRGSRKLKQRPLKCPVSFFTCLPVYLSTLLASSLKADGELLSSPSRYNLPRCATSLGQRSYLRPSSSSSCSMRPASLSGPAL